MAQTLVALPAITSPVTVVQAATLSANVAAIVNLDNRMTLGLTVISKIRQLKAAGGTDYTTNHKQLRQDAQSFFGGWKYPGFESGSSLVATIKAVIDWNAALAADATTPTDVNALVAEMAGFRETPELTLNLIYHFLLYKLAV